MCVVACKNFTFSIGCGGVGGYCYSVATTSHLIHQGDRKSRYACMKEDLKRSLV